MREKGWKLLFCGKSCSPNSEKLLRMECSFPDDFSVSLNSLRPWLQIFSGLSLLCFHIPCVKFILFSYTGIPLFIISFYWVSQMLHFLHIEGKNLYQQSKYHVLYCSGLQLTLHCLHGTPVFWEIEPPSGYEPGLLNQLLFKTRFYTDLLHDLWQLIHLSELPLPPLHDTSIRVHTSSSGMRIKSSDLIWAQC